jgi:hypothetical protein
MRGPPHLAWGRHMRTYVAGKEPLEAVGPDTRDWVFDLLENPRYRERLEVLAGLSLARRPGCEPCLRALVMDDWNYEALYHLGWCESCRAASFALGMDTTAPKAVSSKFRRHALYVVLAAGVAIAAPLAGSHFLNDGGNGGQVAQGGGDGQTTAPATTTPGTTPATTPATTPGATTPGETTPGATTPGSTTPVVTPVARSKPAAAQGGHAKRALPLTT